MIGRGVMQGNLAKNIEQGLAAFEGAQPWAGRRPPEI